MSGLGLFFKRRKLRNALLGDDSEARSSAAKELTSLGWQPKTPEEKAACPSYGLRGKSYLALGQFKEAIADLTIAIGYAPKLAEAYADRAKAHEALGDKGSARKDQEKARELLAGA